jgi:transcriptional regulator with XRE-family HTH domain
MEYASSPIGEHVGYRLRMLRMLLGKSQKGLAETLRLTVQQMEDYENGTSGISASQLEELSSELNVPLAFFFDPEPTNEPCSSRTSRL